MGLRKDIWRPKILFAPIEDIVRKGSVEGFQGCWLPPMGSFQFLADPFALWRDDWLHLFVETYDYRVRVGAIELLIYDRTFELVDRRMVLQEPWHLSYPYVFEGEGQTWMLPEAHRSNRLMLYRATEFPNRWEPAHVVALDHVPVDATPLLHNGLWWLFYTSASREPDKMRALHVAYAEKLAGPWHPHPMNPVRVDITSARPGGTPFVMDGRIVLPVQDCTSTYGSAIRPLTISALTTDRFEAKAGVAIAADASFAPFTEGLHTLASAGPITLIDVKRTELSPHGLFIELMRETSKLLR